MSINGAVLKNLEVKDAADGFGTSQVRRNSLWTTAQVHQGTLIGFIDQVSLLTI